MKITKKMLSLLLCGAMFLSLAGCGEKECDHEWLDATCDEPKTCEECDETKGKALGHTWTEATCETPKTCSVCNEAEGEILGHTWTEADCTNPKTCEVCGTSKGKALEHDWSKWTIEQEADCNTDGLKSHTCALCQAIETKPISAKHTPGEWTVSIKPTLSTDGTKVKNCTICGKLTNTAPYKPTGEARKTLLKNSCKSYSYETIARNPNSYKGDYAKFTGEVIQVLFDNGTYNLRVDITKETYGWSNTIYVFYTQENSSEPRILEDDIITMYGIIEGDLTYTSTFGQQITLPAFTAELIEIQ